MPCARVARAPPKSPVAFWARARALYAVPWSGRTSTASAKNSAASRNSPFASQTEPEARSAVADRGALHVEAGLRAFPADGHRTVRRRGDRLQGNSQMSGTSPIEDKKATEAESDEVDHVKHNHCDEISGLLVRIQELERLRQEETANSRAALRVAKEENVWLKKEIERMRAEPAMNAAGHGELGGKLTRLDRNQGDSNKAERMPFEHECRSLRRDLETRNEELAATQKIVDTSKEELHAKAQELEQVLVKYEAFYLHSNLRAIFDLIQRLF